MNNHKKIDFPLLSHKFLEKISGAFITACMKKKIPLLPPGFYDLLPSDAVLESYAAGQLLYVFSSFGYEQVSPPLMEFETGLLSGRGEALSKQTFRILDPLSHEMMGIRSDMTLQVGRIAVSRLASQPRPVRLCYAGHIVQRLPEALQSQRQLMQAGIELIGSDALQADAEMIIIAAEALAALGINDISIDINLPGIISELCPEAQGNAALQAQIKDAVTHKNLDVAAQLPIAGRDTLVRLMNAAGPLDKAVMALKQCKLPQAEMIENLAANIRHHCPNLQLTFDPVEYRGFDYHSGIGFSIFAKGLRHELGRGGRYRVDDEAGTGFTLYVTHLLGLLPKRPEQKRIMVSGAADAKTIRDLQGQGWTTVYALTQDKDKEAKALGIAFQLSDKGKIENV